MGVWWGREETKEDKSWLKIEKEDRNWKQKDEKDI